jgi:Kef-type K+ transport system membrane component KefB
VEQVLLPLALVLLAAEVGGFISDRLKLTRVAGQITAGLIIGPSILGLVRLDGDLQTLAGFGSLCVLAIAGLETDMLAMRAVGKPALLAAIGGVVLPMILGFIVVRGLGYDEKAALLAGAILTATSVGITAATLRELSLSHSRAGTTIIGAAIIDDVLGLIVLSLVVADTLGSGSPVNQILAMAAVLGIAALGLGLFRHRLANLLHSLHTQGGGIAGLVGIVLVSAWIFETVGGLAAITGAYVAGLAVSGSHIAERLREKLVHAGEALLIPVFLVGIGLSVNMKGVQDVALLTVLLLLVAVIGKIIGSGIGARAGGLDRHASLGVGVGMIARGEVALVAATLAHTRGGIDDGLYAACVLMALGTTVLTPVLLATWARRPNLSGLVAEGVVGAVGVQGLSGSIGPVLQRVEAE